MKLSVVTPSFNCAAYIEACLRSVLDQHDAELEYIAIDGGSTDGTAEIIRRYTDRLAYWVSEPDKGHYDAVNKGFARATGEVLAFINSDDMLAPGCLATVKEIFAQFPEIDWITGIPSVWDESGNRMGTGERAHAYARKYLVAGEHDGVILPGVQQESCFWRRSLWDKVGGRIDTKWDLAGDFDLWTRMAKHAELVGVDQVISGNRRHPLQRSNLQKDEYFRQEYAIAAQLGCRAWLRSRFVHRLSRLRGGWRTYGLFFPEKGPVLVKESGPQGKWVKSTRAVL